MLGLLRTNWLHLELCHCDRLGDAAARGILLLNAVSSANLPGSWSGRLFEL